MDINLLVLNVGNTRLALGVFISGELQFSTRIPHDNRADWDGRIADAWNRIKDLDSPAVAGVSVTPAAMEGIEQAVSRAISQQVEWVGRDIDLPIKVMTENPAETGP